MTNPRKTSLAEEAAERDLDTRWKDPALRAEFGNARPAASAYFRAVARGQVKHTKANVKSLGVIEDARPAASAPIAPAAAGAPDASAAMDKRQRQIASALAAGWYQDPALQEKFPSADAYIEDVQTRAADTTNRRAP
jgi:hypothetical protein